jgi:predicted RNA-binding protein with PUA-like domain
MEKSTMPRKGELDQRATDLAAAPTRIDRWLLKSEPDVFSWDMQKARGAAGEPWTGVRNYLARNNMRAMQVGDLGFFYHSNIGKEIVGIVRVIATAHPDPDDTTGTWDCVDVEAVCDLPRPVTLAEVKASPALAEMALVKSMRLSVQPVTAAEWAEVCRMGGLDPTAVGSPSGAQEATAKTRSRRGRSQIAT